MPKLDDILMNKTQYPDDQTIQIADGSTVTLGELRGGYLRTADYTRKTQELSESRRRFDEERAANDAALAQAREDLTKLAERATQTAAQPELTDDQKIDQLLRSDPAARRLLQQVEAANQRAERIEKAWVEAQRRAEEQRQQQITAYHERTIEALTEKDPSLDRSALTNYALRNGIVNLEIAYRDMNREKVWAEREKAVRDEERKKAEDSLKLQQAVLPVRHAFTPPSLGQDEPKTMDDAAEAAHRDPEIQAILWGQAGG